MVLRRKKPGNAERARALIEEAISGYEKFGIPKHVDFGQALLN